MQSEERAAGGVGVARHTGKLAPAAIVALGLQQVACGRMLFPVRHSRFAQRQQAKNAILRVLGNRLVQPAANGVDALADPLLLLWLTPVAQTAQGDVSGREGTGLGGRAIAGRGPVREVSLVFQ